MTAPAPNPRPGTPLRPRGRFAPSPTGPLHPGSLLAALGSWLLARAAGGEWLVRVEDLDPPREVAGAAAGQLQALAAFGLESDQTVLWQSTRGDRYQAALDHLLASGDAFSCHCSRTDLAANNGIHRRCAPGIVREDPAIRLRVPDGVVVAFDDAIQGHVVQDVAREVGDFVLRRADGWWAYQLAVVVDDATQAITEVVRGADLLDSTPRQIVLQRVLGVATPVYSHLPLLVGSDGHKLSKSLAAQPVDPAHPVPALQAAWQALGQDPRAMAQARSASDALQSALGTFDPGAIPRGPVTIPAATHNGDGTRRA